MDIASLIGLIAALGLVLGSIIIGGGNLAAFIDYPSMMVVIGGSFRPRPIWLSLGWLFCAL